MAQWDYHFEDISNVAQPAVQHRQAALNRVDELGRHGWEMVSTFAQMGKVWAVFKRPLGASAAKGRAKAVGRAARAVAE